MPATGSAAFAASTEKVRSAASSSLTADFGSAGLAAAGAARSRSVRKIVRNMMTCLSPHGLAAPCHTCLARSTGTVIHSTSGQAAVSVTLPMDEPGNRQHHISRQSKAAGNLSWRSTVKASQVELKLERRAASHDFGENYGSHRYAILFFTLLFTLAVTPVASAFGWSVRALEILLGVSLIAAVMPLASAKDARHLFGGHPVASGAWPGGCG